MTFDCERCGRVYRDNYNLNRHINKKNQCAVINQPVAVTNNYITNNYTIQQETNTVPGQTPVDQEHRDLLERLLNVLK